MKRVRSRVPAMLSGLVLLAAVAAAVGVPRPWSAEEALYVIVYDPGPAWLPGRPLNEQGMKPHAGYMQSLFDAGRLYAGGPLLDNEGGLAIVRAESLADARAIAAADPAVTGGKFTAAVHAWHPFLRAAEPLGAAE